MSVKTKQKKILGKKKEKTTYSRIIFNRYSGNPNYKTPIDVYEGLNKEFHFTFDPCPINSKPKKNGLIMNWGKRVFVNPPYSDPNSWVVKGMKEIEKGHSQVVVFLLKGDISTALFHDYLIPYAKELRAIRGRLSFGHNKDNAPFPSVVAIFSKSRHGKRKKQDPRLKTHKEKAVIESVTEQKTNGSENKV